MNGLNIEEFMNLPYGKRFSYTISRIKENQTIWSFKRKSGKFSINIGINDIPELLVWSDENFAYYNLTKEWSNEKVVSISVEEFEKELYPKLLAGNYNILVATMEYKRGKVISAQNFLNLIRKD